MALRKTDAAAELILQRISFADHLARGLPSERQLATSLGISRTTLREAVKQLLEGGKLVRQPNGRLGVAKQKVNSTRDRVIAFVCPSGFSLDIELWRQGVDAALEGYTCTFKSISYAHWADPILSEALDTCDAMFLLRNVIEPMPKLVVSKLRQSRCRIVVLDKDATSVGLPSVVLFSVEDEVRLLDHLKNLGHRRIDCVSTQATDEVVDGRISVWQQFVEQHGLSGQLRAQPTSSPIATAYRLIDDLLREGRPLGTALFCTTGPAAIGAMRALHEAKLNVGSDISVCAVNDEGLGRYLLKTLTALESPSRALYLRKPVEWMFGEKPWKGPMLIRPKQVSLFEGESTGPAPAVSAVISALHLR